MHCSGSAASPATVHWRDLACWAFVEPRLCAGRILWVVPDMQPFWAKTLLFHFPRGSDLPRIGIQSPTTGFLHHQGDCHAGWVGPRLAGSGIDLPLRDRLKMARAELFFSLKQPNQWPTDLLPIARSLERLLQIKEGVDSIEVMGGDLASQVAEDVLSLAVDVAAAFEAQTASSTSPAWEPAS